MFSGTVGQESYGPPAKIVCHTRSMLVSAQTLSTEILAINGEAVTLDSNPDMLIERAPATIPASCGLLIDYSVSSFLFRVVNRLLSRVL